MSETAKAFAWIDSTLRADTALMAAATGGVWQGEADIGVTAPFALFARQAGGDVLTLNKVRLFVDILMQIKAVGQANTYASLVTIADRIDALFSDRRNVGLPGGGGVLACWREEELAYDDPLVNGQQWCNLGGIYHIQLQAS